MQNFVIHFNFVSERPVDHSLKNVSALVRWIDSVRRTRCQWIETFPPLIWRPETRILIHLTETEGRGAYLTFSCQGSLRATAEGSSGSFLNVVGVWANCSERRRLNNKNTHTQSYRRPTNVTTRLHVRMTFSTTFQNMVTSETVVYTILYCIIAVSVTMLRSLLSLDQRLVVFVC